jgi:hypothetical protein
MACTGTCTWVRTNSGWHSFAQCSANCGCGAAPTGSVPSGTTRIVACDPIGGGAAAAPNDIAVGFMIFQRDMLSNGQIYAFAYSKGDGNWRYSLYSRSPKVESLNYLNGTVEDVGIVRIDRLDTSGRRIANLALGYVAEHEG